MSGEVARNLEKAEKLVRAAASLGAKIVVLPETFSTGFDIGQDVLNFAEPIPGKTTDHISALCRELRVFFRKSDRKRKGQVLQYRGIHRFGWTTSSQISEGPPVPLRKTDVHRGV